MTTAFISDLHLDANRPQITALFRAFLEGEARQLDALYILGDLFEAWIGDDDTNPHYQQVKGALASLTATGVPTYFMRGNRDFLIGKAFSHDTGVTILDDPTVVNLYGTRSLLSHGDLLCTDDVDYQIFRKTVHDPAWQHAFLSKPLQARREFAEQARTESRKQQHGKSMAIMDVNQDAVESMLLQYGVRRLIHGHTHRPDTHRFNLSNETHTRIVLGDWYEQGSVLRCDDNGRCKLEALPL